MYRIQTQHGVTIHHRSHTCLTTIATWNKLKQTAGDNYMGKHTVKSRPTSTKYRHLQFCKDNWLIRGQNYEKKMIWQKDDDGNRNSSDLQYNTIQYKTCNASYVTRMLFVGVDFMCNSELYNDDVPQQRCASLWLLQFILKLHHTITQIKYSRHICISNKRFYHNSGTNIQPQ